MYPRCSPRFGVVKDHPKRSGRETSLRRRSSFPTSVRTLEISLQHIRKTSPYVHPLNCR